MTQCEPGFVEQKAGEIGRSAQETVTKEVNNKIDQVERETQTRVRNVIRDVSRPDESYRLNRKNPQTFIKQYLHKNSIPCIHVYKPL